MATGRGCQRWDAEEGQRSPGNAGVPPASGWRETFSPDDTTPAWERQTKTCPKRTALCAGREMAYICRPFDPPAERWQSPVDRARLEIVYTFGYRGFESPPLRSSPTAHPR